MKVISSFLLSSLIAISGIVSTPNFSQAQTKQSQRQQTAVTSQYCSEACQKRSGEGNAEFRLPRLRLAMTLFRMQN